MTEILFDKPYIKYCLDVLSGKILACENIKLQCENFLERFNRDDIYFDYEDVDRRIRFVNKLKHNTGVHNGKPFILMPWQSFLFAGIYGFKWADTNYRVTKNVLAFMARKNAKTATMAAISLIQTLLDNDNNAEIDFVANSAQQARIAFDMTRYYAQSVDPNKLIFKRYRDSIQVPTTQSKIQVLCSDSMALDGYNSSITVIDEFHAQKDTQLYDVMRSSMGMRTQPLMIIISTAGFLLDGYPLYEMRRNAIEILKGNKKDDTQFTLLYELDEGDDPMKDETCWIKANPSLGVTVLPQYLREQVQQAINQPSLEYGLLTKNFNCFVQSSDQWIPSSTIRSLMEEVKVEDYAGCWCYAGLDLAAVSDLTSFSLLFPPDPNRKVHPDKFVFKNIIWLPESCLSESVNKQLYLHWTKRKFINATEGNVTDYDYVLKDMLETIPISQYASIAYDSWNSTQLAIDATNAGLPLTPYSQALGNFNRPTKYLEMLIKQGKVIIDTNECVLWCFDNVKLKFDHNENCKPDKPTREAKIDPVISMCEALGTYLDNNLIDLNIT